LLSSLAGIVPLQLLYVISMVFLQLLYPPAPGGSTYDLVFLMLSATGSTLFWLLFGVSMISLLQFWNRLRRQSLHWTLVHAHIEVLLALVVIALAIFTLLTTTLPGISFPLLPSLFFYLSGLLFFFLIIIFVLFVVLAVLVPPLILFAYLVTRPTIRRIDALMTVTDKLRSGHYAVRASVEGMDEVSQLQMNFNVMANELEETICELQTKRDQVTFLLNERRELFANVSHELRTPIAALRGYLESNLQNRALVSETTLWEDLAIMEREVLQLQERADEFSAFPEQRSSRWRCGVNPAMSVNWFEPW
jgi:signal transduction histidine kinase